MHGVWITNVTDAVAVGGFGDAAGTTAPVLVLHTGTSTASKDQCRLEKILSTYVVSMVIFLSQVSEHVSLVLSLSFMISVLFFVKPFCLIF